jgi:hypothetical protein
MFLGDLMGNAETQAGPLSDFLDGKKRVKNSAPDFVETQDIAYLRANVMYA